MKLLAGLALALLIASPVAAARHYNGKPLPHLSIAGETVAVDPVSFGGSGSVSYTSANAAPWVRIHCYGNASTIGQFPGLLYDKYLDVFRGNLTFTVSETPSWTGGGADCLATLLALNDGYFTPLAETTFAVAP